VSRQKGGLFRWDCAFRFQRIPRNVDLLEDLGEGPLLIYLKRKGLQRATDNYSEAKQRVGGGKNRRRVAHGYRRLPEKVRRGKGRKIVSAAKNVSRGGKQFSLFTTGITFQRKNRRGFPIATKREGESTHLKKRFSCYKKTYLDAEGGGGEPKAPYFLLRGVGD